MSPQNELMNALVDGALEPQEKATAEQALQSDQVAKAEFEWAVLLKQTVRNQCRPVDASAEWRQARARLDEIDRVKKAEHVVGKYSWALCGVFLVAIVSAAVFNRGVSRPLGSAHVAGLFSGLPLEPAATPNQAIESVRRKLGEVPRPMAQLPGKVTHVACGEIDGRRAVRLAIDDGQGKLSFFSVQSATSIDALQQPQGAYRVGLLRGVPAVAWQEGGYLLILTGERPIESLLQSADGIRQGR